MSTTEEQSRLGDKCTFSLVYDEDAKTMTGIIVANGSNQKFQLTISTPVSMRIEVPAGNTQSCNFETAIAYTVAEIDIDGNGTMQNVKIGRAHV